MTRIILRIIVAAILVVAFASAVVAIYAKATGLSARATPSTVEASAARAVRSFAVPGAMKDRRSPVAASGDVLAEGLAHYADHCASCHGNDGSGNTEMGRGLFPGVPDMRLPPTQELSDGELFYIIENGVRFTGMPAWSTGTADGEASTWHLVQFIRHLPKLTPDEVMRMEALNPRSPDAIRQEIEEEQFLQGGDTSTPVPSTTSPHAGAH